MNDLPTHLKAGDQRGFNVRVVDAETGQPIERVTEADTSTGRLTRFAVEDGNLVRDGDRFKMIEETRSIRFELVQPATPDAGAAPLDLSGHEILPSAGPAIG